MYESIIQIVLFVINWKWNKVVDLLFNFLLASKNAMLHRMQNTRSRAAEVTKNDILSIINEKVFNLENKRGWWLLNPG